MKNKARKTILLLNFFLGFLLLYGCSRGIFPIGTSTVSSPPSLAVTFTPEGNSKISCNTALANPAGAYCALLGYSHEIIGTESGQVGMCKFPDGSSCEEWAFYAGKCAANYSYCGIHGYQTQTMSNGKDPFSQEFAVCMDEKGAIIGTILDLSGLRTIIDQCN